MSIASSLRPAAQLDWSVVLIDFGPDRSMCCAVPPRRSRSTCSLSHDHVLLTSLGGTLSAAILERLGVVRTDFNAREGRTSATADLRSARTTRPHDSKSQYVDPFQCEIRKTMPLAPQAAKIFELTVTNAIFNKIRNKISRVFKAKSHALHASISSRERSLYLEQARKRQA